MAERISSYLLGEIETPLEPREISPKFVGRLLAKSKEWLRKRSRRAFTTLGALAFFSGLAYVERDTIMDITNDLIVKNPTIMDDADQHFERLARAPRTASDHSVSVQTTHKIDSTIERQKFIDGTVHLGDAEINLVEKDYLEYSDQFDRGSTVEVKNVYIKNLICIL